MFQSPISSPMITRMLGLALVWAPAGIAPPDMPTSSAAADSSRPRLVLIILVAPLLSVGGQQSSRQRHAAVLPASRSLSEAAPPSTSDDVGLERLGLVLGFFQPRLDHVADRDEAEQFAALHDGQVAEAAGGHGLHDFVDRIVGIAGHDIARHDLPRLEVECLWAVR